MKPDLFVVDIECTCGPGVTKDLQEIIEIGGVRVDPVSFEIKDEFSTLIQPKLTKISPFCERLTGISQDMVNTGLGYFGCAMYILEKWMSGPMIFCSWGEYDRTQFKEQAERNEDALPPFAGFINLKAAFSSAEGVKRQYGLSGALARKGLEFIGTPHRALADAKNTARLVPYCLGVRNE